MNASAKIPTPRETVPRPHPPRLASAASLMAVGVAVLVLIGWIFDWEILKRLIPGLVAMNPATAVCFGLSGAALWILRHPDAHPSARRAAIGSAALVALFGVLKLLEIASGQVLGLDQWLFTSQLQDDVTGIPNRMAPNTAFNFVCVGLALALLDARWKQIFPAQWLALAACLASMLAVLGYAYGTRSFYGVASFIPMALHTALTFLVFNVGILAARPQRGFVEALQSGGIAGAMARRLLPAAVGIPALLGWLRVQGQREGWYESELGISLMVVALMTIFSAVVGWNARLLHKSEIERQKAETERDLAAQQLAQSNLELGKHNAHMQSDLNLAREIQRAFLPQQYISFPHSVNPVEDSLRFHHRYEPNTTLGGDFSDVLLLSDTQAGVLMCDVMGHGVRSALVTAILRGLAEELMSVAHDPGQFLTGINRSLLTILQRTSTPLFATSFYLVADLAKNEIRYASAGHPGPLLLHRQGGDGVPRVLEAPLEPALGVFEDATYTTSLCPLSGGDLLLLYTDGLTEVSNEQGEEWDESGLLRALQSRAHLPAGELLDEIIEEARHFSSSGAFEDDVCLVAMEVEHQTATIAVLK